MLKNTFAESNKHFISNKFVKKKLIKIYFNCRLFVNVFAFIIFSKLCLNNK